MIFINKGLCLFLSFFLCGIKALGLSVNTCMVIMGAFATIYTSLVSITLSISDHVFSCLYINDY